MRRSLLWLLALVAPAAFVLPFAVVGCGDAPPASAGAEHASTQANPHNNFDPASCGHVTGSVSWEGTLPEVAPVMYSALHPDGSSDTRLVRLANAPHVDRITRAIGEAVVFLRGVDTARAKPWDLPAVKIEFRDLQLTVKQGDRTTRAGFVRCGEPVEMQSSEPLFHILRGRGSAFFALAFPEPNQPLTRSFGKYGHIELTDATGCYWQSAHLFVCDHPYYAVTDAEGRFHFRNVPPGQYDLVAWHPNWVVLHTERNPETGLPSRLFYAPPLENSRSVVVSPGQTTLAVLTLPR